MSASAPDWWGDPLGDALAAYHARQDAERDRRRRRGPTEAAVLRAVLRLLKRRGVLHWREQVGVFLTPGGTKVHIGVLGLPDIIAVVAGRVIGIECKSRHGRQSPAQRRFAERLEAAGGIYLLARSAGDVEKFLEGRLCDGDQN